MRPLLNSISVLFLTLAVSATAVALPAHAQQSAAPATSSPETTPAPAAAPAPDAPKPDAAKPDATKPDAPSADAQQKQQPPAANGLDRTAAEIAQARKQLSSLEDSVKQGASDDDALVVLAGKADDLTRGGGNAVGLKTDAIPITLKFAAPVRNVRDERKSSALKDGDRFSFTWPRNEAIVLSFDG